MEPSEVLGGSSIPPSRGRRKATASPNVATSRSQALCSPSSCCSFSSASVGSSGHIAFPVGAPSTTKTTAVRSGDGPKRKKKQKKKTTVVAPHDRVRLYAIQKERLLEFNLELDINNLKQEIRNLDAMRQILQTIRHRQPRSASSPSLPLAVPTASLPLYQTPRCFKQTYSSVVSEYYRQFRHWNTPETLDSQQLLAKQVERASSVALAASDSKRRRTVQEFGGFVSASEQRSFLESAMHPEVDCCDGIVGVDAMWQQINCYGQFMRPLWLHLHTLQIVDLDTETIVKSHGSFCFQVQRSTIETIFPHVMRHPQIVAQLVGRLLDTTCELDFFFDKDGKVTRYVVSLDLVTPFLRLLGDPQQVAILLNNAMMGSNYAIEAESTRDVTSGSRSNDSNSSGPRVQEREEEEEISRCPPPSQSVGSVLYGMDGRLITCDEDVDFEENQEVFV